MNFRFAHYDPPKPKVKTAVKRNESNNKSKTPLPKRSSKAQQKRKDELHKQDEVKKSSSLPESDTSEPVQLLTPPDSDEGDTLRVELPIPQSALNTLIGQGNVDPFQVYPVPVITPYVHEVLNHAINKKWAKVSPSPSLITIAEPTHPVKRGWLQCAMSSPVAFYALFYAASQHLNYLQKGLDSSDLAPTLRLSYKTKAIALINHELSHLNGKPLSDGLLIAILSLGAHGNKPVIYYNTDKRFNQSPLASAQMLDFYGHIDQEEAHMSALRTLLAHNKGVDGIKLPGLLGALQLGDTLHSTITGKIPSLLSHPRTLPAIIAKFVTQPSISQSLLPPSKHTTSLLSALASARALTAALEIYTPDPISSTISLDELTHARNLTHHTLISLPHANPLWGREFALYDAIRLAARIYSDLVIFPLPASTGVRVRMAVVAGGALAGLRAVHGVEDGKQTEREKERENGEAEVLLWCTILALIAAEEVPGSDGMMLRGWLGEKMLWCAEAALNRGASVGDKNGMDRRAESQERRTGEVERGVKVSDWEKIEAICEKILWWNHVCSGRGEAVWEKALRSSGQEMREKDDKRDSRQNTTTK